MKQNPLLCLCLALSLLYLPTISLQAAEEEPVDTQAVADRANQLLELLDHLLVDKNHSSIQQIITEGDEPTKILVEEAARLKSEGERLLAENDPMQAAVTLQAALDHVFMAIRQQEGQADPTNEVGAKFEDSLKVNDTFLAAAARVVESQQNPDAGALLDQAREARVRADGKASEGDEEQALLELAESTRLAQQAIMKIRNGQVIERRQ